MTDEQKIELAAKFGIGPNSGLEFANAIEQASRRAALEESVRACEDLELRISKAMSEANERDGTPIDGSYLNACDDCADAIRALSGPTET